MKAVYIQEFGGPEQLLYGEMPEPRIESAEVLIRVKASSINRVDVFSREGSHGTRGHGLGPRILGRDAAGEVVQVGDGVTNHRVGDRVMALVSS